MTKSEIREKIYTAYANNLVLVAERYKVQFGLETDNEPELVDYPIYICPMCIKGFKKESLIQKNQNPLTIEDLRRQDNLFTSILMAEQKQHSGCPTGFIIDESAHLKKGECSVGVGKQYAGVVGKVENSQVGVYVILANDRYATLIGQRLFLPQKWTEDARRCDKAGVPKDARKFKTKPQLAFDLVDEAIANGVQFDWIGGDGLYGHSYELSKGLDERSRFFVLDAHKDELVYLQKPVFSIPTKTGKIRKACQFIAIKCYPNPLRQVHAIAATLKLEEGKREKNNKGVVEVNGTSGKGMDLGWRGKRTKGKMFNYNTNP